MFQNHYCVTEKTIVVTQATSAIAWIPLYAQMVYAYPRNIWVGTAVVACNAGLYSMGGQGTWNIRNGALYLSENKN